MIRTRELPIQERMVLYYEAMQLRKHGLRRNKFTQRKKVKGVVEWS